MRSHTQTPPTAPRIQKHYFIWVQQNFLTLHNVHSKHNAFRTRAHPETLTQRQWQRQIRRIIKHPRRWSVSSLALWHSISLFYSVCSTSLFSVTNVASRIMWWKIKLQLSQQAAWASDECWWIKGTWQQAIHPRPGFWFLLCQLKSVLNNNSFTLSHFAEFCSTICSSKLFRANLDFIITKSYWNNKKKFNCLTKLPV